MLFYLDKTIGDNLKDLQEKDVDLFRKYSDFLEDLGRSAVKGYCYLCGERQTMKYLSRDGHFGGFYKVVNQKYSESGAVLQKVPKSFVLTFLNSETFNPAKNLPSSLRNMKPCVLPVDKCITQGWRFDIECCLLGENVRDCYFYVLIGERYRLDKSQNGVRLNFLKDHGGGSDTGRLFLERVQENHIPTLCITDSDWKYGPSRENQPEYGGTADNVRKAMTKLLGTELLPLYYAYTIEVHEAENLIPLQVLEEMLSPAYQDMSKGVNVLNRLANLKEQPNPLLFYDFKAGIPLETGKEAKKNSKACVVYWSNILKKLGEKNDDFFVPVQLTNLLEKVVEHISNNKSKKYLQDIAIDSHLQAFWEDIGKEILTWGCAFPPVRV